MYFLIFLFLQQTPLKLSYYIPSSLKLYTAFYRCWNPSRGSKCCKLDQFWKRIHNFHTGFQILTDSCRIGKFIYFIHSARGLWRTQEREFSCSCAPTLSWQNPHSQKLQLQEKSCLAPGLHHTYCE